jgi:hypothetical protein
MSRTTYRLFDGMTLVSTAVKLMDGSILMSRPWLHAYNNVNHWKTAIETENDAPLSLSTHETFPIDTPNPKVLRKGPVPHSPYTPPAEPIAVDPFKLGPTMEGSPYNSSVRDELTDIHSELACLSRIMNRRLELVDIRVKALLQKLD